MKLRCTACGREWSIDRQLLHCPCGGLLEVEQDERDWDGERLRRLFDERLAERRSLYASGVWRYKELIHPLLPEDCAVTKYEGNTGLYASEPVRAFAGVAGLLLKAQSENPSGSFKDNGMVAAVSHGLSLGYRRFACTSTGNTSASLAMYAALAGCQSYVFVPESGVAESKVLQTAAYGARLIRFEGTYDDGIRFLEAHAEELELYVCNSVNPLRIEGQKSMVYELAHSLQWSLPDWIVLPGGALSNASALGKGLRDLLRLGLISRLPRVLVVQAEGASPFHRLMAGGGDRLEPEPRPWTLASALNIGNPPSWEKARGVLRDTDGLTVAVSDGEILEAKACIDRAGIGCEPASAAAVAGLRKLVREGRIDKEASAVCLLTGHLLKDLDALKRIPAGPSCAAGSLEPGSVRRLIEG
ncbi:L-threonine synthase [Paenibacillus mucilaginosus 3016]|uniref:Threonine synthase n=2 Tax=Paenibacillus mucilaginosus TaxID=61624 RepID=H6NIP3_9BACL|nr:threonine synthase [Paenibacillus mucilaginosus]AFC33110.1 L-threonine synthase [Paenibacillus mucilaginosus 3016]AFH65422.2 L-threonine synthase [Paenibacillus mucilaginosus K02]WFA21543.1 threonine synthase [Paenibacillus mucilaginosus]